MRSWLTLIAVALACAGQPAADSRPHFEVATTRFNVSQSPIGYAPGFSNGRFRAINMSLRSLLAFAYGLPTFQISGPDWLDSSAYDIQANVPENATRPEVGMMLQVLLEERLKVATHRSSKQMNVYNLVVARGGAKLHPFVAGEDYRPRIPEGAQVLGADSDLGHWGDLLSKPLGRPVLDKTGISGRYRILIVYDDGKGRGDAPSLTTALEEQLGLRLESAKADVEMIVVDRAERTPVEN